MASQSLYRKWRSQRFNELIGQEEIVRTLKNALKTHSLAHAYLFTGPRGTGKTTMARLLAKSINCANPVDGEPCNVCQQCREITAGNSFNVIEIDAASNRGIDSIRDLREKIMMPPSTGKYKVYVLDEAHMLTTEAFNALLKTLEEPPSYAIFVLATTDVHKMLPTVLSRCQRFDFKRITTRHIVKHVRFVAEQEQVKIEQSAAELIARAAAGGMRDALSLLDQAIAYCGNEITLAQVQAMLGVADPRAVQKLIAHVADLDSAALLHLIHDLAEAGADLRQVNSQVGEYWRALMLAKAGADIATILDYTEDEVREIGQALPHFALEELTEFARIFAQNELVQKNQGTPQLGLELAFLQCIELHRAARSGQLPTSSRGGQAPILAPPIHVPATPSEAPRTRVGAQFIAPAERGGANAPETSPVRNAPEEIAPLRPTLPISESSSDGSEALSQPAGSQPSLALEEVKKAWESVKKRVKQKSMQTAAMLNDYRLVGVECASEEVIVAIQAEHEFHHKYVIENDRAKDIDWALTTEFQQKCRVRLLAPGQQAPAAPVFNYVVSQPQPCARQRPVLATEPEAPSTAPKAARQSAKDQKPPQVEAVAKKHLVRENKMVEPVVTTLETLQQKASNDPVIKEIVRTFGAKIIEVRPK